MNINNLKINIKKAKFGVTAFTFVSSFFICTTPLSVQAATSDYINAFTYEEYIPDLEDLVVVDPIVEEKNNYNLLQDEYIQAKIEEFSNNFDTYKNEQEYELYLTEYSMYFNLNPALVIEAAKFITNNYQTNLELFSVDNKEKFAMMFVYKLYGNKLSDYGYNRKDFKLSNDVVTLSNPELILSNGYTFNDYIYKMSSILNVDPKLLLAVSSYETGYQSSYQALNMNNFGGLGGEGGYMTLPTPEAGIIYYSIYVSELINNYKLDTPEKMYGLYVTGNINANPTGSRWVGAVNSIYYEIDNNEENYFSLSLSL